MLKDQLGMSRICLDILPLHVAVGILGVSPHRRCCRRAHNPAVLVADFVVEVVCFGVRLQRGVAAVSVAVWAVTVGSAQCTVPIRIGGRHGRAVPCRHSTRSVYARSWVAWDRVRACKAGAHLS